MECHTKNQSSVDKITGSMIIQKRIKVSVCKQKPSKVVFATLPPPQAPLPTAGFSTTSASCGSFFPTMVPSLFRLVRRFLALNLRVRGTLVLLLFANMVHLVSLGELGGAKHLEYYFWFMWIWSTYKKSWPTGSKQHRTRKNATYHRRDDYLRDHWCL